MSEIRELLANAIPDPEDEPQQRDVIGTAMAWGQRRRHQDRVLTGVGALAVIAVSAGVVALGTGGSGESGNAAPNAGSGTATSPGVNWAGQALVTNGGPIPDFKPTCQPPSSVPPADRDKYCVLWKEQIDWMNVFAKGSVPYIQASLPQGFTVKASQDSYVVELTGPDGKTNILFPSAASVEPLNGQAPGCAPSGSDCMRTSIGGGQAVVGQYPSAGQSAEWEAAGLKDPRILLGVNVIGTRDIGGLPAPTGGRLLSSADLARIIANPDYVKFAKQQWQHEVDIQNQIQKLQGPSETSSSGSATGSAPATSSSGSTPGTPAFS